MKLKKSKKKSATLRYRTRMPNKNSLCARSGTVQNLTHSATLSSISRSVITCTVQVNRTSWLRKNNDEKFCKITKICLLETNSFMCIDKLPYPSSFFFYLNCVSRRQFFINIGNTPKMQKVRNDRLLDYNFFIRRALFPN